MTVTDWAWLCRARQLHEHIYLIDADSMSAHTADSSLDLPWNVALLLGSHSRKHVFLGKNTINMKTAWRAASGISNRLKWSWLHRASTDDTWEAPLCKREPLECKRMCSNKVNVLAGNLKRLVVDHVVRANRRIARSSDTFSNRPAYVTFALKWMKKNGYLAAQSDKDGVFVLVRTCVYDMLIDLKIGSTVCYRRVYEEKHIVTFNLMKPAVHSICKLLREAGCESFARECESVFFERGPKGLVSKVVATIKTHKPVVECRVIHASVGSSFAGFSTIMHRWLSGVLAKVPHLFVNSAALLNAVNALAFPSCCVFSKWDIKEFYMSGEHKELVNLVLPEFEDGTRVIVEATLYMLLCNQFVQHEDSLYQVCQGTGMGMIHSGSLSDLAFWKKVEVGLPLAEFGVHFYGRYRDDVLVISNTKQGAQGIFDVARRRASGCWNLVLEDTSTYSMHMLDLLFYKGPRFKCSQHLDFAPYIKPTARHVPLHTSSAHAPAIHEGWPVGEVSRMRRHSYHGFTFEFHRRLKVRRFARFFLSPKVIRTCKVWRPPLGGYTRSAGPVGRILRVVLPWHPALKGLCTRLNLLLQEWGDLREDWEATSFLPRAQVAYSMAARPLHILCRSLNRTSVP